jgi:hypothetical protein
MELQNEYCVKLDLHMAMLLNWIYITDMSAAKLDLHNEYVIKLDLQNGDGVLKLELIVPCIRSP